MIWAVSGPLSRSPKMTFDGAELYPSIETKAAALCFSLVMNYPFLDGNKRIGHAVAETSLVMNGFELIAPVDEAERIILALASGNLPREKLLEWFASRIRRIPA